MSIVSLWVDGSFRKLVVIVVHFVNIFLKTIGLYTLGLCACELYLNKTIVQ